MREKLTSLLHILTLYPSHTCKWQIMSDKVSRLKEGVYSFLMIYNTSYFVKEVTEIWAKECKNGVQKKDMWPFFNQTRLRNDFAGL